jgi:6-phosphogluconolactonase (cycloisomerase 2 family)
LALTNNGADNRAIAGNGSVTFASQANASAYSVAVATQPANPTQTCTVSNGTGTISSGNVANVIVACTTNTYSVSVAVSGLTGTGLVLQNNGAGNLVITGNGTFTFATQVNSGAAYDIKVSTVATNPLQLCTVTNGAGTVTNAAITAPSVACGAPSPRTAYAFNYYGGSYSIYNVDAATGQLRMRGYAKTGQTPSDAVSDRSGKFTYILNFGRAFPVPPLTATVPAVPSSISAFTHDDVTGDLVEVIGSPYSVSTNPFTAARISMHPSQKFIYVTKNPPDNNISAFAINGATGALTSVAGSPVAAGTTPGYLNFDAAGQFAYLPNGGTNDIYVYSVDGATGALTEKTALRTATGPNPNFLWLHPNGKFAYVINRNDGTLPGSISAYTVNATTGALTAVSATPYALGVLPGTGISFHPNGKFLYARNQEVSPTSGSISAFSIDANTGALTPIAGSPYLTGVTGAAIPGGNFTMDPSGRFLYASTAGLGGGASGVISAFAIDSNSGVLTSIGSGNLTVTPGPFWISVDPSGNFVYQSSVQADELRMYKINQATGALTPQPQGTIRSGYVPLYPSAWTSAATAPGPNVFKPKFAYVPNATDNTISTFTTDAATGALTAVSSIGAQLPQGVAVMAGGKFAYSVNAGSSSVSAYSVNPTTGALTATGSSQPTGTTPSAIATDPSGRFVYVANFGGAGGTISAYRTDPATGALTSIGAMTSNPGPVNLTVDPTGRNLYVNTLTTVTTIEVFAIDNSTGALSSLTAIANGGAVQSAVDPKSRYLYLPTLASTGSIEIYPLNGYSGAPGPVNQKVTGHKNTWIAIDPTGRFAYTANTTDNSITAYSIDPTAGTLTEIGTSPTPATAQFVSADFSGKFLYASLGNKTVATYSIDQTTGALTLNATSGATTGNGAGPVALFGDVQ